MSRLPKDTNRRIDIKPPPLIRLALEWRCILELLPFAVSLPVLRALPKGDGHPVLVLPGFMTGDWGTTLLRWYLKDRGYDVHGWSMGLNKGHGQGVEHALGHKLIEIYKKRQCKISIIGYSLGGLYAREMAKAHPDKVRMVITFGSCFSGHPKGSNLSRIYAFINGFSLDELCLEMEKRCLCDLPPVPATAIHSLTDGMVSRECTLERDSDTSENITVRGSHNGLTFNPRVLWTIADRLAQPENRWQPFGFPRITGSNCLPSIVRYLLSAHKEECS